VDFGTRAVDFPYETGLVNLMFEVVEGFDTFGSPSPVPNSKTVIDIA